MPLTPEQHLQPNEYYAKKNSFFCLDTTIQTFKVELIYASLNEGNPPTWCYRFTYMPTSTQYRFGQITYKYPHNGLASVETVKRCFERAVQLDDGNLGVSIRLSPNDNHQTLYLKYSPHHQLIGVKVEQSVNKYKYDEFRTKLVEETIFSMHNPRPKTVQILEMEAGIRIQHLKKIGEYDREKAEKEIRTQHRALEQKFRF